MRDDEFNSFHPKNEFSSQSEFGKVQTNEFSSTANQSLPKDEVNQVHIKNESVEENRLHFLSSKKVDIQRAQTFSHGFTSVIATASVVAVVGLSTLIGFHVASQSKATCAFTYFGVTSSELSYELVLSGDEKDEYSLYVENTDFSKENPLLLGSNKGQINGLTEGSRYQVSVRERKNGGKVIYQEEFTPVKASLMKGLVWDKTADFNTGTFEVAVDYVDELMLMDDFTLTFYYPEEDYEQGPEYVDPDFPQQREGFEMPLEKTREVQRIETWFISEFREEEIPYEFSYTYAGNRVVHEQGKVKFIDKSEPISEIYGVIWDQTANFDEGYFDLQLSYEDEQEIYSDFQLKLTPTRGEDIVFNLEKTTDVQRLYTSVYLGDPFAYEFSCLESGEKKVFDQGQVVFTDVSPAPTYSIESPFKLGMESNFMPFRLHYDEENSPYSSYLLRFEGGQNEFEIYLEATTEWQFYEFYEDPTTGDSPSIDTILDQEITLSLYGDHIVEGEGGETTELELLSSFTQVLSRTEESEAYGIKVISYEIPLGQGADDVGSFAVQPIYRDEFGSFGNLYLGVTTVDETEWFFPFAEGMDFRYQYQNVRFDECINEDFDLDTFVSLLRQPVNLSLVYDLEEDLTVHGQVTSHEGVLFNLV